MKFRLCLYILPLAATMILAGCGGEEEAEETFFKEETSKESVSVQQASASSTTAKTATPPPSKRREVPTGTPIESVDLGEGLKYDTMKKGEEEGPTVVEGKKATFDLVFYKNDETEPLWDGEYALIIGSGMGFIGLDKAVRGMNIGDERRLTVPGDKATLPTGNRLPGLDEDDKLVIMATLMEVSDPE